MKRKNIKDNKGKKIPQAPNTFVPQNLLSLVHEEKIITCPEEKSEKIKPYKEEIEPFEIPPLWIEKSAEEINSELLQHENITENSENIQNKSEVKYYDDPKHNDLINNLPLSFIKMTCNDILWLRPENYIINENIDKEIRRLYPKKKHIQMREDIKEVYKEEKEELKHISEEENMDDIMNDDALSLKRTIYKDFYKFLDNKPKIFMIKCSERDETDEEYHKRVEETIEKQKELLAKSRSSKNKSEKKPIVQQPNEIPKGKILIKEPGNIDVRLLIDKNKKYNKSFISWISSIYQFILDLKIKDCNTYNSIFENIYPQKNKIPIYNPNGHYIVKMYFMGNARKIDIDDRIPCNKDGEYILPRCESLTQIWPAILTKALLKLNMYKAKHPFYTKFEENIDISYIYALTGFHTRILNFEINHVVERKMQVRRTLKSEKINLLKFGNFEEDDGNKSNKKSHHKNHADLKNEHDIENILYVNLNDDNYLNNKKYVLCVKKKKENIKDREIKDSEMLSYEEIIEEYNKQKGLMEKKDSNELQEIEKNDKNAENEKNEKNAENEQLEKNAENEKIEKNGENEQLEKNEENKNLEKDADKQNPPINNEKKDINSIIQFRGKRFGKRLSCPKIPRSIVKIYQASQMVKDNKKEDKNKKENNEDNKNDNNQKNDEKKEVKRSNIKQKTLVLKTKDYLDKNMEIIDNYAYSVIDFFSSDNFNMDRLKPLDFEDIKKKLKTNNIVFKQLSKQEKREYIRQRKILKSEQILIKNNRIEALKTEGKPFLIIKLINNCFGQCNLQSNLKFNDKEIFMAKKCILNNWKYPPPDFFEYYFKKYDEDSQQQNILEKNDNNDKNETKSPKKGILKKMKKKKISSFDWTRENYLQLIGNDLSKYKKEGIKEPLVKPTDGDWLNYNEFIRNFNCFLILSDPSKLYLGGKLAIDNNWKDYKVDCFEPSDDFVVLKLNCEEINNKNKMYNCFLVFEPNNDKNLINKNKIDNYIIIDIVDKNKNYIYKNITLNKFYSTYLIEKLKGSENYYIIIKGGIYEFGYYLQVYSESHKIENMTYHNYLSQELEEKNRYQLANFKIEHSLIDTQQFYLLTRLHIIPTTNEDGNQKNVESLGDLKIVFNLKYPLKHLKYYIKIFIQKENDNNDGKEIYINEEILLPQGSYLIAIYFKNLICPVKENTLDIDISYYNENKNYHIEQIDNIDFYEVGGEYNPNKYNIIFKEIIFSCDKIYASLSIEIKSKELKKISNINDSIKLVFFLYKLTDDPNIPLIDKKISHSLRGQLIKKYDCFNSLIIPNIKFEGGLIIPENKKSTANKNINQQNEQIHHPYLLICCIDESFDVKNSIAAKKLDWKIKVFSSDNLCFIDDTSKEQNEIQLKSGWEENEPGRSEKAKISRKKYLLGNTLKNGGVLSETDRVLLYAKRIRKTSMKSDELQCNSNPMSNKSKKIQTKIQISAKKLDDKETKKEDVKEIPINFNKYLPKLINHQSSYIKNYLQYVYNKRTKQINTIHDQYKKTINNELIQSEKTKKIYDSMEKFNNDIKLKMYSSFYKTEQPKDEMFSTFYKSDISTRSIEKDIFRDLYKSRDALKCRFKEKILAKNNINDILNNSILYGYDYQYMFQCYKDAVNILGNDDNNVKKLFKLISSKKEEDLKNQIKKFTNKDKANIVKIIEEIELNKLLISEETMGKLRELIK